MANTRTAIRQSGDPKVRPRPDRIAQVLREHSIVPFYQPILDVRTGAVVGHEALARFPHPHPRGIPGWFSDALAAGMGTDLEWLAATTALPHLHTTTGTFLALNMSPAIVLLLAERDLCNPTLYPRVVIELTEHTPIDDYTALHRALAGIRREGARVAVDDLGAGYAGFRHLIALQPDIIKLDITLIRNIHRSPLQQAMVRALLAYADDVGAQVIAEGVEPFPSTSSTISGGKGSGHQKRCDQTTYDHSPASPSTPRHQARI